MYQMLHHIQQQQAGYHAEPQRRSGQSDACRSSEVGRHRAGELLQGRYGPAGDRV